MSILTSPPAPTTPAALLPLDTRRQLALAALSGQSVSSLAAAVLS